jgi:hypothetical protein
MLMYVTVALAPYSTSTVTSRRRLHPGAEQGDYDLGA